MKCKGSFMRGTPFGITDGHKAAAKACCEHIQADKKNKATDFECTGKKTEAASENPAPPLTNDEITACVKLAAATNPMGGPMKVRHPNGQPTV